MPDKKPFYTEPLASFERPAEDALTIAEHNRLYALIDEWKRHVESLPYPWCIHPDKCKNTGRCHAIISCGD